MDNAQLEYASGEAESGIPAHLSALSLEGMHGTVAIPHHGAAFWKQWRAYVGPALLISIGYMDPGNWATDLEGGARFGLALHVGEVLYGNIGSGNRLDFTCIGPAVNLAARIEKLTSELGRTILATGIFRHVR